MRELCDPDGADLLAEERLLETARELPVPATLLWAARGMADQPPGLYGEERLAALGVERVGITARSVPDTNHDSIVGAPQGVAAIAGAVRATVA